MAETTNQGKFHRPHLTFVPRPSPTPRSKIKPIDASSELSSDQRIKSSKLESIELMPSRLGAVSTGTAPTMWKPATFDAREDESRDRKTPTPDPFSKPETKSPNSLIQWYQGLTPNKRLLLKVMIIGILALLGIAAIVVPIVIIFGFHSTYQQSSSTNITVSACASTTCIGQETPYHSSIVTLLFPFDGNANDISGLATGTLFGTSLPSVNVAGYIWQSLIFTAGASQYVAIPSISFAQQSFTIQLWIYTASVVIPSEWGMFGQCDSNSVCLSLSLKNNLVTLSFDSMNSSVNPLTGNTLIVGNPWTHISIVYDAVLLQQRVFVNGFIDAVSQGLVYPYRGITSGSTTTIGRTSSFTTALAYFPGRIDYLTISLDVARSACQILNDATLVSYYPFDTVGQLNDYSVYFCNGIASGISPISNGRIGQAISFSSTSSYFQSQCFPSLLSLNPAYTVTLWINPNITINGGTLVRLSTGSTGGGLCYDLLVFTPGGTLVLQWMNNFGTVSALQGPLIPINTWTHVAVMYGQSNGVRLYINGQFIVTSPNTASINYLNLMNAMYITLGNSGPFGASASCTNGAIPVVPGPYTGVIDDFRLYNRELDAQELCVLVNH